MTYAQWVNASAVISRRAVALSNRIKRSADTVAQLAGFEEGAGLKLLRWQAANHVGVAWFGVDEVLAVQALRLLTAARRPAELAAEMIDRLW